MRHTVSISFGLVKLLEAGRIAGTVIAETICTHDDYKAEFEAAKEELLSVLGLPHV
ncbi:hypothetical protein ACU8M5_33220 (plasmid) [Rhizobium leguminosarum]